MDRKGINVTNTFDGSVPRYGVGGPDMPRNTRVPVQPDAPGDIWKTNLAADAADAADVNDDTLSGMEIPLYAISDAGNGNADDEMATALRPPHKRPWLRILLIVLAVLAVAAVAGFFTARWYYQDKAAPGVMFAGASVAGQNSEQLAATVKSAVENTKITVTDSQGNAVTASLKDLGVNVNQKQTVSALIAAKDSNPFVRINPFSKQNVKLSATADKLALSQYLTGKLIPNDSQAIASTIAYDQTSQKFTVTVGRGGQAPVTDNVVKAIDQALDTPGTTRTASITYTQTDMPISEAAATTAADQANAGLGLSITINNGDATTYKIPVATIASWTVTTADPAKGTIAVSYNKQAISDYMNGELATTSTRRRPIRSIWWTRPATSS